jgi:tetratricopeptide (TPR) repeat protein
VFKHPLGLSCTLALSVLFVGPVEARVSRAVAAPAAPVTLLRNDADLFSATLAGRYAQGTDNPQLAAQAWSRAFMRRQSDGDLFKRALDANLEAGDVAAAVQLAKIAAPAFRNDRAALVLAVDAFASGRYNEVTRILGGQTFQPSLRLFVDHLSAYALLGQNKPTEAIDLTSRASGNPALDKTALMSRAMILNRAGRASEAGILFQSSLDSGSAPPIGVRAYGDWLVGNGRSSDATAMYLRLVKAGGVDASGFAASLAQVQPSNRPASSPDLRAVASNGLVTIVQGLVQNDRLGEPIAIFNLVAFLDPRSHAASVALSGQLIASSRGAIARPLLERVPATSVDYFSARSELAWLAMASAPDQAVTIARETLANRPNDTSAKRLLADILAATRSDREAETIYTALIETGRAAGQSNEEIWPLYFGRGGTRERQGNWAGALPDLRFSKAAAPNQPNVLNYLGYALADRGESIEEALSMLRTAARLQPRSGAIQDSLGWALHQAGRYEEAVATLEAAANMSPALAEISDHLGDAYWRSGREDEARMEWGRTLRLPVTAEQKQRLESKLANGLPALNAPTPARAIAAQPGSSTVR